MNDSEVYLFLNSNKEDLLIYKQQVDADNKISYKEISSLQKDIILQGCDVQKSQIYAYTFEEGKYTLCQALNLKNRLFLTSQDSLAGKELSICSFKDFEALKKDFAQGIKEYFIKHFGGFFNAEEKLILHQQILDKIKNGLNIENDFTIKGNAKIEKNEISKIFNSSFKNLESKVYSLLDLIDTNKPIIYLYSADKFIQKIVYTAVTEYQRDRNKNFNQINFKYTIEDFLDGFDFDTTSKVEAEKKSLLSLHLSKAKNSEERKNYTGALEELNKALSICTNSEKFDINNSIKRIQKLQNQINSKEEFENTLKAAEKEAFLENKVKAINLYTTAARLAFDLDLKDKALEIKEKIEELEDTGEETKKLLEKYLAEAESVKKIPEKKTEALKFFYKAKLCSEELKDVKNTTYITEEIKKLEKKKPNFIPLFIIIGLGVLGFLGYKLYPTILDMVETKWVSGYVLAPKDVNVRNGSSNTSNRVSMFSRGDMLLFSESEENGYYPVKYTKEGNIGYIYKTYFGKSKPAIEIDYHVKKDTLLLKRDYKFNRNIDSQQPQINFYTNEKVHLIYHNTKEDLYRIATLKDPDKIALVEAGEWNKIVAENKKKVELPRKPRKPVEIVNTENTPKPVKEESINETSSEEKQNCGLCEGIGTIKTPCPPTRTINGAKIPNPVPSHKGSDKCRRCGGKNPTMKTCTKCNGDGTYNANWTKEIKADQIVINKWCINGFHNKKCKICNGTGKEK